MKKIFILLIALSSFLLSNTTVTGHDTRFTKDQVIRDINSQNYDRYTRDNLAEITTKALLERKIISKEEQLIDEVPIEKSADFLLSADCSFVNIPFTATIYDYNPKQGKVSCMVAYLGNLNNPIGKFTIDYPNAREFFTKDVKKAMEDNKDYILNAESKFESIKDEKERIFKSVAGGENYINMTDLVIATLLTDTDIIDIEATNTTKTIQLKDGLSSKVFNDGGSIENYTDNSAYILQDLESIFVNYIKLSDIAMEFYVYILFFIAAYGLGSKFVGWMKKEPEDYKAWGVGAFIGLLLFVPISDDTKVEGFDHMQTQYQSFERGGYSLFSYWADKEAKVIIDTELEGIIDKSGIGTKEQIINSAAGANLYYKLEKEVDYYNSVCNEFYHQDALYIDDKKTKYKFSNTASTPFPTTENWGYAMALYNNDDFYYTKIATDKAYNNDVLAKYNSLPNIAKETLKVNHLFYPQVGLASCGKNYFNHVNIDQKLDKYLKTYGDAIANDGDHSKIEAVRELVRFQYELQRDFGFLAILGLPITKLQTEMIGGIYKNNNKYIDAIKDKMISNEAQGLLHSVMSSIPYMFVPGAGSVYNNTLSTVRDIKNGYTQSAAGLIGGAFGGNIAVGAAANVAGFTMAYIIAKNVLLILPLVALIAIGLLRFIVILVKIFILHFGALFMLPMAFIKNNLTVITHYTVKVFATMLELPIFVLSVYLAMTISPLLNSLGTLLTSLFVNQMLVNNEIQHSAAEFSWDNITSMNFAATDTLKIYFISGFFEVLVALSSIFIIYKIIVTMHTALFEAFELKTNSTIDGFVDDIRSNNMSFGGKV